ncbi:MAG TPA: FG-GAP repeat protein, partial [Phycisphaerae bacterium]|nr:FG-GAP repeat protein [Phycisphaerae bacterium]
GGVALTILGANADDNLGSSITSGDVNNDGYDDLLVCASGGDFGALTDAGIAYLFYGGPNFFATSTRDLAVGGTWDVRIIGPISGGDMGGAGFFGGFETHAADIGNLNGDDFGDIALGVHKANGAASTSGRVYVVAGQAFASGTTLQLSIAPTSLFRVLGRGAEDELGDKLYVGDITGDGLDELIIPNHYYSQSTFSTEGAVLVLRGRTTWAATYNLATAPADITLLGNFSYDELGTSLAIGDFNGDHVNDFVASAPGADVGTPNTNFGEGFVYGFLGGAAYQTGTHLIDYATATPDFIIKGESLENLGDELAAGDFNGDGIADVAAAQRFGGAQSEGTIDIVYGRDFTPNQTFFAGIDTDARIVGNAQDRIGFALGASDVNSNGVDEVLFGTPFNNGPSFSELSGTAYVFELPAAPQCGPCGDLDGDLDVDADDYALFRSTFGRYADDPAYIPCADYDNSGAVGLLDYGQWLACYRAYLQETTAAPAPTPTAGQRRPLVTEAAPPAKR